MGKRRFVHLHTHSEYSLLDGLGRQGDFLQRAFELDHPAIAFTEHGSMRGIYALHSNAKKLKTKWVPRGLFGVELYLCRDRRARGLAPDEEAEIRVKHKGARAIREAIFQRESKLGLRQRQHLTVLAKNNDGLKNLFRLTSVGWLEGFWKRPRVDLETLDRYGDGLIVLSGCVAGVVADPFLRARPKTAIRLVKWLRERFGEDFYLEVMPNSLPEQRIVNSVMGMLHRKFGIPLVATADCHYVRKEHVPTHELLLCVRTHDVMSNPDRFRFSVPEFWLKSRAEMLEGFEKYHGMDRKLIRRALDTTLDIAEKCEAKLEFDKFAALVPSPGIPKRFGTEFEFLSHLCWVGWEQRDMHEKVKVESTRRGLSRKKVLREYLDRLNHELNEIKRKNVVRYFLVVWDLMRWARKNEIECGPGRGSAGGCLISYLLFITDVDPVEHRLLFERFLNPDRTDLPDIDLDFEDARRDEVLGYLRKKYGESRTAHITTITTLKGKQAIRDIGRALEIPFKTIDPVANAIIDVPGSERIIENCFEKSGVCRVFDKQHPEVLEHAKLLEGHARGLGLHAAGVVVSPVPLKDVIPLEVRQKAGEQSVVTGLEMEGCQQFGLLKIDLLGLRNLTVVKLCLKAIMERHGKQIDLNKLPLDDKQTLQGFTDGAFVGIFQFDTASARSISKGVQYDSFEDIVALNALNRPGTARSGLAAEWLKRKADPSAIVPMHPTIDRICADTLGVIIYQEQFIKVFIEFAGFKPGEADLLRKKVAKSKGVKEIAAEHDRFVKGAKKLGNDPKLASKVMHQLAQFGAYSFGRAHAAAYALIAYREMWLKAHYPHEFMLAVMQCEKDEMAVSRYLLECNRLGVKLRPPHVNRSKRDFALVKDRIVGSLTNIKGVGSIASDSILAVRGEQRFRSFVDFMERIDRRKANKRVVLMLVKAGALDKLIPNRKWFIENIDEVWKLLGRKEWQAGVRKLLRQSENEPGFKKEQAAITAAEVCPLTVGKHPIEPYIKFLSKLTPKWIALDDPDMFEQRNGFICGVIVGVRYKRVGEYNPSDEPKDEDERKRLRWGEMFANIQIEQSNGAGKRIKVDVEVFDQYKPILDKGNGTPIAAHVALRQGGGWESLRVHFMVDVAELRRKVIGCEPLSVFDRALLPGAHPVEKHSTANIVRIAMKAKKKFTVVGLVTHLNAKLDRRNEEMAFFGLLDSHGNYLDALCFASSWQRYRKKFGVGDVVRMQLVPQGDSCFLDAREDCRVEKLSAHASL